MPMDPKDFCDRLEYSLAAIPGSITPGQALSTIPRWDSLAVVNFLALADTEYGKHVEAAKLRDCQTVDDLMRVIDEA